ncbi:hypothetical protein SORBI_3009G005000 [Sorghum bicolor]|uniref:Protein kinase domain-containing protein n=2 Tax=Sorghum bicolor TaxID=4558 RepID=A0A1B6P5T5_SORBI|nr:hypothetical protein SORBI_3009G005000 [Sorghum bicolor]
MIAVLFCLIRKRQLPYQRLKNERKEGGVMKLEFLVEITSNFSEGNILGTGAFGQVYKGVLYGKEIAAVKRLFSFDKEAFKRELNNLGGLNHQNIVQLLGYCYETRRELVEHEEEGQVFESEIYIAMVFEYMHKGSLQKYLQDESGGRNWKADYKIIKGTCEGLRYLHKGLKSPMLHLDLKPSNILLSKNMVPKLADFGLSTKLVSDNQTQATPRPFGTRGYMPPEYIPGKDVTEKFDIFSLGVVMLDIISGPEGYKKKDKMSSFQEFINYVQKNWRKDTTIKYEYQVKRCLEIAMECVNPDQTQRPSIDDIISKLKDTENSTEKKTNIENLARTFTSQNET